MKKRNTILLVVVALLLGIVAGHIASSVMWKQVLEDSLVAAAIHDVSSSYLPLELLGEGNTNRALARLESDLQRALSTVQLHAETLNRPDMLTHSIVIAAKTVKRTDH